MTADLIPEFKTRWHFCISLDNLLKQTMETGSFVEQDGVPLTETQVYELVKCERLLGRTYFSGCDNIDTEGKCAGHLLERIEPEEK